MNAHRITEADYEAALVAGRFDAETEFRARAVRYLREPDVIEIITTLHAGFLIPRAWVGALRGVPIEELAKLKIWPDGSAIELEHLDIQISVHGLLTELLPVMLPAGALATVFASRGGQVSSDAKRRSARANGRRGGRPRKKAIKTESAIAPPNMQSENEEVPDTISAGPLSDTAFTSFFKNHHGLVRSLIRFSPTQLIACVGGLLTMPEWQASTLRLEVLQHLIVASSQGRKKAAARDLKTWLSELGDGLAGRLEDPSEDVFAARVHTSSRDYLVFEGIYEASAFHLQRFLNILEAMPTHDPYAGIRRAVCALLSISNEVAHRANVSAFAVGQTEPLRDIPTTLLENLALIGERVTFSRDEVNALGIDLDDLRSFIFDPNNRDAIRAESLGHSTLERFPLIWIRNKLRVALPTAVSVAIRRLIIEFCLSADQRAELYASYANEMAATFKGMPLLGGRPAPTLQFHLRSGIFVANLSCYVDRGRLLHMCFLLDDFDSYAETGMTGVNPNSSTITNAIEASLAVTHRNFASKTEFKEALSVLIICPWGRPMVFDFAGVKDLRWRVESTSAADLAAISWQPTFSPLGLWRLLDSRDALTRLRVELVNFNGLLNLYAWSESLEGHLIPHGKLPDDHDAETQLNVLIPQNGLLEIRRKGAEAGNVHLATTWDHRTVKVRRHAAESFFDEDRDEPLYVSLDDLDAGQLLAVFETRSRGWWVTIETPNITDRDLHYRLWHALTVWIARAAPPLEEVAVGLPDGSIAWVCTFHDSDTFPTAAPIPTYSDAAALLEVTANGNVVNVTARRGFLASFRNATNVGERLLVELFAVGAVRLSGAVVPAMAMQTLVNRIVPSEWARDMHLFSAQRFRDLVRGHLPKEPILITKSDDAHSRIGLGWRARNRAEGARIDGIDACCTYLAAVVDKIWEDMREVLKKYNRKDLVMRLVANHESISAESDRWLRTARSMLSLHDDKEAATREATYRIAKFNAGSLSTRIVIEMALCECPQNGGEEAGALDIARLLANAMQLHHLGGSSEAIKYGGKKAEIRVTPLGDIHTQIDFEEKIADPYGQAIGRKRFRSGADVYETHFREPPVAQNSKNVLDSEFLAAWTEAYGFTIDEMRIFMDSIDDEGLRRNEPMFISNFTELSDLNRSGRIEPPTVRNILDALTLQPRVTWASTPNGFSSKDWYPWRFRRRLSAIARPILQLTEGEDPSLLIAPGLVREGAAKLVDYCLRGGYDAKDFRPGRMRAWIGAEENRRGNKFNSEVAERLEALGWRTRSSIRATELLNDKLDRDYGDFDVFAWRDDRVLAIECKDLELAMTAGEIARQLDEFRGEIGIRGKPDRLKKHLLRVELLRLRAADLQAFVGSSGVPTIEAHLVFSGIVPMHFSELATQHGVRSTTFDDLENI